MAKKTLGFEELNWTCPNCEGLNPGAEQTCGNCGAPQPDDVKFEQAARGELLQDEEKIERAKAGPDIHCPYCGTRNPGNAETCSQCGGDLVSGKKRASGEVVGAFKTGPTKMVACPNCAAENPDTARTCTQCGGSMQSREQEKPAAPAPSPDKAQKKGLPVALLIAIVVFCCIAAAVIYFLFFRSETLQGTVRDVGWERVVEVEGLVPVEHSAWYDQVPSDGELLNCEQEVRAIEDQPQANAEEVCGTPYSVDTGSGYAEVVQDCEYHIYDDYCSYTLIEWAVVDTVSLTGNDFNPVWPEPSIASDQRLGDRTETYLIYFDADSNAYTYSITSFDDFQQFDVGSQWNLEVNTLGGVLSVEP